MTSAGLAARPAADAAAYRAVEHIYHSYLTGLILMLASRTGAPRAAEVVFRTFRRQQLARFLPGLKKLGLDQLPHAVACAQYHYLSNQVGGVGCAGARRQHQDQPGEIAMIDVLDRAIGGDVGRRARG